MTTSIVGAGSKDWADFDDDTNDVSGALISEDPSGCRTFTTYFKDADGMQMKCERKVAVSKKSVKIPKRMLTRSETWRPFGLQALDANKRPEAKKWLCKPSVNDEEMRPGKRTGAAAIFEEGLLGGEIQVVPQDVSKKTLADIQRLFSIYQHPDVAKLAKRNQQEITAASAVYGGPTDRSAAFADSDDKTIRISNLPDFVSDEDVQFLCNRCGRVVRHFLVRNKETNASKGYAFVTYESREQAAEAIQKMNKQGFQNAMLSVEWAKRRPAPQTSGLGIIQ